MSGYLDLGSIQVPWTTVVFVAVGLIVLYLLYDLWRTYIR